MSRSAPNEILPNPCTQWMEWRGGEGNLKYYDRETKENVVVEIPFEFILLDKLGTIKGWHDASEAGIFSNEVRDTRKETLLVRSHKMKEPIAEGFYSDIKDKVKANGGKFVVNLYVAFTNDAGELAIGSLQFHGAALSAWMDFENDKANKPYLYKKGIKITGAKDGKKGSIKFKVPMFDFIEIPSEMDNQAALKDSNELQPYLKNYFGRARTEQTDTDTEYDQRSGDELEDDRPPF